MRWRRDVMSQAHNGAAPAAAAVGRGVGGLEGGCRTSRQPVSDEVTVRVETANTPQRPPAGLHTAQTPT